MTRQIAFLLSVCAAFCLAQPVVVIVTELGNVVVKLDGKRAPRTTENFLRYVDARHYNGGVFHRAVTTKPDNQPKNEIKIDVVQASANRDFREKALPPIALESTNVTGIRHLDGVISMARSGPGTATSDFFICIGDQPSLDFGGMRNPDGQGFAAFGRVVEGMDVVRKIQTSKAEGQRLTPAIRIELVKRR